MPGLSTERQQESVLKLSPFPTLAIRFGQRSNWTSVSTSPQGGNHRIRHLDRFVAVVPRILTMMVTFGGARLGSWAGGSALDILYVPYLSKVPMYEENAICQYAISRYSAPS
jgi:hypothetical protein